MAEETWHEARLIPTSGIKGAEEQERRATSALLAVMVAVKEFGRVITRLLGAPAGEITTYIEVPFGHDGQRVFPDGLIRVTRGRTSWTALVEVKTSTNRLEPAQIESYLNVARVEGFNALLTISNEMPPLPGVHPTPFDRRKIKKTAVHHLSWTRVLTEAVIQKTHRGVSDPDQAWILGELIRYLEHPKSGAMEFEDMGASWPTVREAVRTGTLRANDKTAIEVATRWDQLMQYVSLHLGRKLGVEVEPLLTRRELDEPKSRTQTLSSMMEQTGRLEGGVRIPGVTVPMVLTADLRAQLCIASMDISAPRGGRQTTRVNWLLRQLKGSPDNLRIDAFTAHSRGASTSELLRDVRDDPSRLVADPKKDLRSFRVAAVSPMGTKRGGGRGSFVGSFLDLVDLFYASVVQNVRPWSAGPPPLRQDTTIEPEPGVEPSLASTALSSQDLGREEASGTTNPETGDAPTATPSELGEKGPA